MPTAVPMVKVAVVGPKSRMEATIETLHRLRLVHIEDYTGGDDEAFDLGSPLEKGEAVSERLLRLRSVLKNAEIQPPTDVRPFTPENLVGLRARLEEVEQDLARLVEDRSRVVDDVKRIEEEEQLLERVRNLPVPLEHLHGFRSLSVMTGFVPQAADTSLLREADPDIEVVESEEAEGRFLVVYARRDRAKDVNERLAAMRFSPVDLPKAEGRVSDRIGRLDGELTTLRGRQGEIEAKIDTISQRHAAALYALDEDLNIEADKATAPVRFRTTRNSFVVEGWVPERDFAKLEANLHQASEGKVYVTQVDSAPVHHEEAHTGEKPGEHEAHEHGDPPVKLQNKGTAGVYTLLTDTYARPKYGEVDPTKYIWYGFPFFYGFMLGDIGYAVVLFLLIKTGVFSRVFDFFGFESKTHLNRILFHSAAWSLVFGILYTELFGLELVAHHGHHGVLFGDHGWIAEDFHEWAAHTIPSLAPYLGWYPISRFIFVPQLLLATVAIGWLHMMFGLTLGFRNAAKAHGVGDAMKHRGSWLGMMGDLGLVGIGFGVGLTNLMYVGGGLFGIGLVLLVAGEGPIGVMEVPTILSNLLSYTRLVAIGLSSAGIALAGNQVATLAMDAGGVVGILGGVLILLLFHTLNVGLGVIGPALHSLRLHYVEFFTKFYEGGGTPYQPFGSERKYTQKEVTTA